MNNWVLKRRVTHLRASYSLAEQFNVERILRLANGIWLNLIQTRLMDSVAFYRAVVYWKVVRQKCVFTKLQDLKNKNIAKRQMLHSAAKKYHQIMQSEVCMKFIRRFCASDQIYNSRETVSAQKIVRAVKQWLISNHRKPRLSRQDMPRRRPGNMPTLHSKQLHNHVESLSQISTSNQLLISRNPIEISLLARTRPRNSLDQLCSDLKFDLLPKRNVLPSASTARFVQN